MNSPAGESARRLVDVQPQLLAAIAQLRHAYEQLTTHDGRWSRRGMKEFADGLIAPQIRKLEQVDDALSFHDEQPDLFTWAAAAGELLESLKHGIDDRDDARRRLAESPYARLENSIGHRFIANQILDAEERLERSARLLVGALPGLADVLKVARRG